MLIHFLSKSTNTIFVLLIVSAFHRDIHAKSLVKLKHRNFVKRDLSTVDVHEEVNQTSVNSSRRSQRHDDRLCDYNRLRTAIAKVCLSGVYAPRSSRGVNTQRTTRHIVIRIPRNIRRECCQKICSAAILLRYCQPVSENTSSTSTTTENSLSHTPISVTENNSVDEENQINLESQNVSGTATGGIERNTVVVISDPPDDNIFAVDQETNDVVNY